MVDSADLLFELGTEELPPVALKKLSESLTREFIAGLDAANLKHGEVTSYAAPRRLAILIKSLDTTQPDRDIERKGPAVKAAFDAEGNATKAAEGFARSCGTTVDKLDRQETSKGEWLVYQIHETGKAAKELLPAIAENALHKLPIPKRMRWGDSDAQFVRPVQWLLFLHGENVIDCEILEARADNLTFGHRFHHPDAITIYNPEDYASVLESMGKVIAHFPTRRNKIKMQVKTTALELGGVAGMDDALLDEVTALNEWPMPIAGSFEEKYLEVPHEALVTTMKTNQKYFPVFDKEGGLMNYFITIANIESKDPSMIKSGNERVVRPRLADAMFFWEQDGKRKLEDMVDSLKTVVFQKKLGSMYEKSQRVSILAGQIAEQIGGDIELSKRAGQLSRCDLMTEIVGEFASMQGIMGRYQAGRDGENPELAQAMDEFYMPRFSGDQLPQTKTGIAIALAERFDTLVGIFGIGMKPTGDKDPFALRRAALGALRIVREHSLTLDIRDLIESAKNLLGDLISDNDTVDNVDHFMLDRLRGLYADAGITGDLFDAVAAVKPANLADFNQRIQAVSNFRELAEAESLAAANKRIRNILKKSQDAISDSVNTDRFEEDAEGILYREITHMREIIAPQISAANYAAVLKELAGLREAVDTFFDKVMVMADDIAVRNNRLALLSSLSSLFLEVADISVLQPKK